ncbi:MAG: HEAT repeat domain-containing protein [Gemmatimonadota bacterium]|nr:HEAT repeat domain-containing protein [Gemmatimonadota bacterium]
MTILRRVAAVSLLLLPEALGAQALARRVEAAGDGTVRMSFAAREGVCGSGSGSITIHDGHDDDWVANCDRGPVRVSLTLRQGRVTEAHSYVGGRWRQGSGRVNDLGSVPAREASAYLLTLAPRAGEDGGELITAATLADSATVWPSLLRIAREEGVSLETRRQAVFWLGQAAGKAAARGLDSIAVDDSGDIEVRKQAVFALSQRPEEEGVPVLIHIARSNPHPEIRKSALFWLGQSEDPRALALFEELLQ